MPCIRFDSVNARRFTVVAVLAAAAVSCACAGLPSVPAYVAPLAGNTIALLGEVHDNRQGHAERLTLLRSAIKAGWRPVIVMEQFDTDRQADIDRARREAPRDAQHVIDLAAPTRSGWDWDFYRPVIELALQYDLPLRAANLPDADTSKVVRGGYAGVFDAQRLASLSLTQAIEPAWQAAQEREIDTGHCGMLPVAMWPAMARAQFARDAVMASVLRDAGAAGTVLIAGNGHVRRDIGVARWLAPAEQARVVAIGFLEGPSAIEPGAALGAGSGTGSGNHAAGAFDSVVRVPPAARADPCEAFGKRALPAVR